MTAPENNQAFDFACACKLGRILGGHDPVTAVRRFPRVERGTAETMEQHRFDLVKRTLAQTGGNVWATSRILDVNKTTIYDVLKRGGRKVVLKSKKIIRMAACVVALMLVGCVSRRAAEPQSQTKTIAPIMPSLPTLTMGRSMVAPAKTNGVVTLVWDNGEPAETVIINQTTGAVYPATTRETLTVGGLAVGSQQTFVATNTSGSSLPASVTVTPDTMRLTYQTWLYLTWPGPAGTLQRSTNLIIWQDDRPIAAGGSVIITNKAAMEFYRVKL